VFSLWKNPVKSIPTCNRPTSLGIMGLTHNTLKTKLQGLTIISVDDSLTIRRTIKYMLKKYGCHVITAKNGFDALPKIAYYQPDIIILDSLMPILDGYQTCLLIRDNPHYRTIPVLMLSSIDGLFERSRAYFVGVSYFMTLPFNEQSLLAGINQAMIKELK